MQGFLQVFVLALALSFPLGVAAVGYPHIVGGVGLMATASVSESNLMQSQRPLYGHQPTPTAVEARFSPLDVAPPPTVAVPATAEPQAAPPSAHEARERAVVYNTDGAGAKLRTEPFSGAQVAALREGQELEVLEHADAGGSEWLRVKTPDGAEGWVIGRAARITERAPSATQPTVTTGGTGDSVLMARPMSADSGAGRTHTVQPGDRLKDIAAASGVSMETIIAVNDIPNADNLTVGQVLTLPDAH